MENLREWFLRNRRDLPWRGSPSPYAVWVSEVMLQQTQVSVVIPYFHRWMERFPTVEALAAAPLEEVIKLWEGLGYYSRARNLHAGAQQVVADHGGVLPREGLEKIKGLGPYTVAAICAFAFWERAAPIDGNVRRVLFRYLGVEKVTNEANQLLPKDAPWEVAEALIELGALICSRKPKCDECPIQSTCRAFSSGMQEELLPKKKVNYEKLQREVWVVHQGEKLLVQQGKKGKVMEGLFEFSHEKIDLPIVSKEPLPKVRHTFTRFRVELDPWLVKTDEERLVEGFKWVHLSEVHRLPFSSGHRRVLQHAMAKLT